jgi:hypothetical protein
MHARENSFADFFVALTVATVIAIALHFAVEPRVLALRHRMVSVGGIRILRT